MKHSGRVVYLSNARLPSEKANALQSLQQCEAFGRRVPLEFWHPRRAGTETKPEAVFTHYGIQPTFALHTLPSADSARLRARFNRMGFLLQATSFQAACALRLLRERRPAVIYTRNPLDLFLVPILKRLPGVQAVFLEDHDGLFRRAPALRRRLLRSVDGLIVTTALHAESAAQLGVPSNRILVAPNAVNVDRFPATTAGSGGPPYRVMYVGNLFVRKGALVLIDALSHLPTEYSLEIVGGSPESREEFDGHVALRGIASRVVMHGVVPPSSVPRLLEGATVAVLPNSGRSEVSSRFTSPLKMFEYMASGVPIVASDVPAIRQVLRHDVNAWLVAPDDPAALAAGIAHLSTNPGTARRLATQARADVASRTWDARAVRILEFMGMAESGEDS